MSTGKHAYLILAHTRPKQVRTLLSLLDDPRNDIYIHIDRKASFGRKALEGCCAHSAVHFVKPRISVHWGGVSIMRAELALLKAAVPGQYAFYHLLSGQDLPIKRQDEILAFFDAHPDREFLNYWEFKSHTLNRVHYFTVFPEGAGSSWVKSISQIGASSVVTSGVSSSTIVTVSMLSRRCWMAWFTVMRINQASK